MTPQELAWFVGRTDDYAVQTAGGGYQRARKPLTLTDLQQHLDGTRTIGCYTTDAHGLSRALCIDLDSDGTTEGVIAAQEQAEVILNTLPDLPFIMEFSGSKGWHLWLLLTEPVPHDRALGAGQAILTTCGWTVSGAKATKGALQADLFPQGLGGEGLGKLVKLPLGVHRKTGRRSHLVSCERITREHLVAPGALPKARAGMAAPAVRVEWDGKRLPLYPWQKQAMQRGMPEGFRNRGLFYCASWLITRTQLSGPELYAAVHSINQASTPPLAEGEVNTIIRSAARRPMSGTGAEEFTHHGVVTPEEVSTNV